MANGYPTGVSTQPLDFGSIASNYMQSAVEQKLQEIKDNKIEVGQNMKDILKAMSISTIPELSGQLRSDFDSKIEKFRADLINRARQSEGKLSLQDRMYAEKGVVDLSNQMNFKKNLLDKGSELKKILMNPSAGNQYDVDKAWSKFSQWTKDFESGKNVSDPVTILAESIKPTDFQSMLVEAYNKNRQNLGYTETTEIKDGKEVTVKQTDPTLTQSYLESFANANFQGLTPDQKKAEVQKALPTLTGIQMETRPYVPKNTGGGYDLGEKYKRAVNYDPQPQTYKGQTFNIVKVPGDIAQSTRNFFIQGAVNLDTNKASDLTEDNAQILGVDVDNNKLILQGKGGVASRDGNPLYLPQGVEPTADNVKYSAVVDSDIKNPTAQKTALLGQFKKDSGKKADKVTDINVTESDGKITVSGKAVVTHTFGADESTPVSVTYNTFTDPKSNAIFTAPLDANKPAVAAMFGKVKVRNKPFETYFDETQQKKIDVTNGLTPAQQKAFSALKAKNPTLSDEQLMDWINKNK